MKINTKVRYGLRAMTEIRDSHPSGILQKQIAESQGIPLYYLDSIITGLRNANLISNFAGKSSGYVMVRPANEISVYDIYRAFEPEMALVNCSCPGNECKRSNLCPTKDYWFELNKNIIQLMKSSYLDGLTVNINSESNI
jgi:Rrf2 family protein